MPLDTIEEHSHEDESSFEENPEEQTDKLKSEDRHGFTAVIFYLLVFTALGIPVWYKTTTPVRYPVPDVAGLMVHTQMMVHRINVDVVFVDETQEEVIQGLPSSLRSKWAKKVSPDRSSSFIFNWDISIVRNKLPLMKIYSESAGKTLDQIDLEIQEDVSLQVPVGSIRVFVVWKSLLSKSKVAFGRDRNIFVSSQVDDDETHDKVIATAVLAALEPKKYDSDMERKEESSLIVDPKVNFFINIILEEATDGKVFRETGKLQEIHSLVGDALLKESGISQFMDIEATTRMVYYAIDSRIMESLVSKQTNNDREIDVKNIPILINSIESRIVDSDTKSSFNLNLIIPSSQQTPLIFVKEDKEPKTNGQPIDSALTSKSSSRSNVLMTTSKAGFIVWNKEDDFNLGLKVFMRRVLDMSQSLPSGLLTRNIFFPLWELDSLQRSVCQRQLLKSLASLESVEKLLGKVSNIVIKKEVSDDMHLAVKLNHEALTNLAEGRLGEAFASSSQAYTLSEKAFFDPSLLALLYFPEDQKYAVYFPLFLPVSLPLLSSVYYMSKFYWNKSRRSDNNN